MSKVRRAKIVKVRREMMVSLKSQSLNLSQRVCLDRCRKVSFKR